MSQNRSTCDARFIPNTPNSAPTTHDDGTPIKCTLDPNHTGAHFDGSAATGETVEWSDLDTRQVHAFPMTLPSRQTVPQLRAYARGFGLSLPSRIKKADLVTLAQTLRYGTRADVLAEASRLGATVDAVTFDRARTPVDGFDAQHAGTAPKPSRSTQRPSKPSTPESPSFTCAWFATCVRPAAGYVHHPVLGDVATCAPCASKLNLTVTPF